MKEQSKTHEEKIKEKRAAIQEATRKRKEIKEMYNMVFATPEGLMVLRDISELAGHNQTSVIVDPTTGEINIDSTVYNEARRNLYLQIREHVRPSILKKVEFK